MEIIVLAQECFDEPTLLDSALDAVSAGAVTEKGDAIAVSFAGPYIATPDLLERFSNNQALSEANPAISTAPAQGP